MQILGVGIDIVSIDRVRAMPDLDRAAAFVFLPHEREDMNRSRDAAQYFAARFALKEAVIKAVPRNIGYHDIAIRKAGSKLEADVRGLSRESRVQLSAAHEFDYAVGHAIVFAL